MSRTGSVYFGRVSNTEKLANIHIPTDSVRICDGMFRVIEHFLMTLYKVENNLLVSVDRYPIELFTSNNSLRIKNMQVGDKIDKSIIDNYLVSISRIKDNLFVMEIYKSNNNNRTFNFMFSMSISREDYLILAEDVFKYFTKQR